MNYLSGIRLKNYCGYKSKSFNFIEKNIVVMFGPNGCGKSTLLKAIELIGTQYLYKDRDMSMLFRKLCYSIDYDPAYSSVLDIAKNKLGIKNKKATMEIEGVFNIEGNYKNVFINQKGLIQTSVPLKSEGYVHTINADNPINSNKFQIDNVLSDIFLDIAQLIYGFKCFLGETVEEKIIQEDGIEEIVEIHTDLILEKRGNKIHYKSFSDGEKKIATLLRQLCNIKFCNKDIVVIDNIEKEIYFKRHKNMIDKILEYFPDKQFFIATHSPLIIQYVNEIFGEKCLIDLEKN